jgi:2'-5' RNA ligase
MILTARIAENELIPFDLLRQKHFPEDRNLLRAHLTMFHRLPGEYVEKIVESLRSVTKGKTAISAKVSGVRHLGAGVAFTIGSPELNSIRDTLRSNFVHWLGSQDMQTWQPHITIQNKALRAEANRLHRELANDFHPHDITIVGLDLWRYLNGPWASEATVLFAD